LLFGHNATALLGVHRAKPVARIIAPRFDETFGSESVDVPTPISRNATSVGTIASRSLANKLSVISSCKRRASSLAQRSARLTESDSRREVSLSFARLDLT
jgi:hypothetical protein